MALVTGSGKRRVGWHVAEALAGRGYALAVHYRSSAQEAEDTVASFRSRGVRAQAFHADLTDEKSVQRLIDQTLEKFGRMDVLVNCAAVWQSKKLEEVTAADVRFTFETNTLGTFLCSQRAGLAMVKQKEGGSIITLGDWAIERPYAGFAVYFPSKGAIPEQKRLASQDWPKSHVLQERITLRGEIIDPKCYLGAMKPGGGKTHKACAMLCLSGGIPPMFVTRDAQRRETFYLLTMVNGSAATETVLPFVGDPVAITGRVEQHGDLLIVRIGSNGVWRR